ncbi:NUDIX domain-containing protein [Exiguobacterium sp. SH0S1]|uniref:NUDIX hydrolase n=1 Tax=Exiguobacterium sp. SH0S1 TaxID=2510949 RepID=UPI00103BFCE3|nr:NUDIX domain-containing protein [Exiguobacterium sp. SH0S1]TCI76195.1 NUDIX domain-containing protein [Exiguobacterium sp. SH0S1]
MIEFITVVDRTRKRIGLKSRADVHRDGDWHETFHCWMIDPTHLYLQLRSETKQDFPGLFDITAAGHLAAGETVRDGVREIQEELGIELSLEQLHPLGVFEDVIETGAFLDREFAHTYVYPYAGEAFKLDVDEVADVGKVGFEAFVALLDGSREQIEATSVVTGKTLRVTKETLVPHPDTYWNQVVEGVRTFWEKAEGHDD